VRFPKSQEPDLGRKRFRGCVLGDFICQGAPVSSTEFHHNSPCPNQASRSDSGDNAACELRLKTTSSALQSHSTTPGPASRSASRPGDYEVLTSTELAGRLKVRESWIVDQSKRSRTHDPIPVFRLGKHRRYRWGSPELNAWLDRRAGYNTQQQRKAGSQKNGGTI